MSAGVGDLEPAASEAALPQPPLPSPLPPLPPRFLPPSPASLLAAVTAASAAAPRPASLTVAAIAVELGGVWAAQPARQGELRAYLRRLQSDEEAAAAAAAADAARDPATLTVAVLAALLRPGRRSRA